MHPTAIEKKAISYLIKNWQKITFILLLIAGFAIRFCFIRFESGDYKVFLEPWFTDLKNRGGFSALSNIPGDYNAPYMTILAALTYIPIRSIYSIKAVSIFFDILLAFISGAIASTLKGEKKPGKFFFITVLFVSISPVVVLNSSAWGQCDSIYGSFCLLSFYSLLKDRKLLPFLFLGVALAFKLQAIFLLPIILLVWLLKKSFSILNILLVPLTLFVCCLPAIFFGMPIERILTAYIGQTSEYSYNLTANYPNIYSFLSTTHCNTLIPVGLVVAAMVLLVEAYFFIKHHSSVSSNNLVTFSLIILFTITMFLPEMHERYAFVAETLAIIYFVAIDRNYIILFYAIAIPLSAYSRYLFGNNISFTIESLFAVLLYVYAMRALSLSSKSFSIIKREHS